jgi:hypothetical protein
VGGEVAGLVLGKLTQDKSGVSNPFGFPELYRPIINAATGQPATVDVSVPRAFSGRLDAIASSQVWGAEANAHYVFKNLGWCWVEALAGFRHLGLNEGLDVVQISRGLGGLFVTGALGTLTGSPRFRVVAVSAKFGGGVTDHLLRIGGSTTFTQGGEGVTFIGPGGRAPGGVLAGPSNIGSHRRTRFSSVAEGGLEWGSRPRRRPLVADLHARGDDPGPAGPPPEGPRLLGARADGVGVFLLMTSPRPVAECPRRRPAAPRRSVSRGDRPLPPESLPLMLGAGRRPGGEEASLAVPAEAGGGPVPWRLAPDGPPLRTNAGPSRKGIFLGPLIQGATSDSWGAARQDDEKRYQFGGWGR